MLKTVKARRFRATGTGCWQGSSFGNTDQGPGVSVVGEWTGSLRSMRVALGTAGERTARGFDKGRVEVLPLAGLCGWDWSGMYERY